MDTPYFVIIASLDEMEYSTMASILNTIMSTKNLGVAADTTAWRKICKDYVNKGE